ncbi:tetratricopeptide repeat protein [Marinilabiliaceae bacterium ANBcel2]|nr:tetratricopeptide repeat protein [Marinilabiliaceae bacterium ANBcel2]
MRKILLILSLITLFNSAPSNAQFDTDRMLIIGRNALYFEDYVLAIQYFNNIIRTKPYLTEPYYFRAIGKYNLDDLKGAEADCNNALERNPYFVDAYNLRGVIRKQLGRLDDAIKDFERGLELSPENINLLINMGIAQLNKEEYEKAIKTYNEALRISPNRVPAYLNRGHAKVASKDTLGGLEDFNRAIELNPYIPDGFANRAIVNYELGNFDKALEDLSEAIDLRPEDPRLYMHRGVIRYQLDDLRGTVDDFDKVIELDPRNAVAYANRGILRAEIGDINRAIDDFSRVLALRSDDLLTLYHRALLYMQTGEYNNAIADLDIIADNYPDFAPVFFNRAQAKQILGNEEGAELDYMTAMTLEMDRRDKSDLDYDDLADMPDHGRDEEEEDEDGRRATRRESDTDIRNYDRIAILDDFGTQQQEDEAGTSTSTRGRIQHRNIVVDLEPMFGLTFHPGDTLVHRMRYFNLDIDRFNRNSTIDKRLEIANHLDIASERDKAANIFEEIENINTKLENIKSDEDKKRLLLKRGTLYITVENLNSAMDDFDRVLELNPDNYLALFNRAYTRYQMVELMRAVESDLPDAEQLPGMLTPGTRQQREEHPQDERTILDYDLMIEDLNRVIEIKPDFEFAYYNLGMINALTQNLDEAIEFFNQAITLNGDMAEAWFNRGLIYLYLDKIDQGTLDLSKAGELGLYNAYNVIKRYGRGRYTPIPTSDSDSDSEN